MRLLVVLDLKWGNPFTYIKGGAAAASVVSSKIFSSVVPGLAPLKTA